MQSNIERRISRLEDLAGSDQGPWCPECGHGKQLVILNDDELEPMCTTCGRPVARGDGIRIIRVATREDGPQ